MWNKSLPQKLNGQSLIFEYIYSINVQYLSLFIPSDIKVLNHKWYVVKTQIKSDWLQRSDNFASNFVLDWVSHCDIIY